jgi:hypothetical protein
MEIRYELRVSSSYAASNPRALRVNLCCYINIVALRTESKNISYTSMQQDAEIYY